MGTLSKAFMKKISDKLRVGEVEEKKHRTLLCIFSDDLPEFPCACVEMEIKIPSNIAELIGEEKLKELDRELVEKLRKAIEEGLRLRGELKQAELKIVRKRLSE